MNYHGRPLDSPPDHGEAVDRARLFETWIERCLREGPFAPRQQWTVQRMMAEAPWHLKRFVQYETAA